MPEKYVLRGTGDEGVQWVKVSYEETSRCTIRVTGYQPDIPITPFNEFFTQDIKEIEGREFRNEQELNRRLSRRSD